MEPISIDYTVLLYIMVGLFALVGFFRGWLKEGITTLFLVLLITMLTRPEMAKVIIGYINNIIKLFWIIVETGGRLEVEALSEAAKTVEPPIRLDPENSQLYVGALVFLVVLSYMTGKITFGGEGLSAASRLMGGILGALNGYLILSLAREYVLGFFLRPEEIVTQEIPERLSIQIEDMPRQSLLQGYFLVFVMVGGLIVFLLILATSLKLQSPVARKKKEAED